MQFDEDVEKRTTWTNIALFMVGMAILGIISLNKNDDPETLIQQTAGDIVATETSNLQNNPPAGQNILTDNSGKSGSSLAVPPFHVTDNTNHLLDSWSWVPQTNEQPATDLSNYIEKSDRENDELTTASR